MTPLHRGDEAYPPHPCLHHVAQLDLRLHHHHVSHQPATYRRSPLHFPVQAPFLVTAELPLALHLRLPLLPLAPPIHRPQACASLRRLCRPSILTDIERISPLRPLDNLTLRLVSHSIRGYYFSVC